jgi:hypothetical protein
MVNLRTLDIHNHTNTGVATSVLPSIDKKIKKEKNKILDSRNRNLLISIGIVILLICIGLSGCENQTDNNGQTNNEHSESIMIGLFVAAVRNNSYAGSAVFYAEAFSRIGKNLTYEVDTGEDVNYNGSIIRVIGHGHKSTHTYYKSNTSYTVKLIVRDDLGNVNSTTRTISIGPPPAKPLFYEHYTNLPEMNGIPYDEVYQLYKITAVE